MSGCFRIGVEGFGGRSGRGFEFFSCFFVLLICYLGIWCFFRVRWTGAFVV